MRVRLQIGCAALAALLAAGCAAVKPVAVDPPEARKWTPADYATEFGDADPWEGFNRSMFAVNRFGMLYVLRPVGWVYGAILPRPVIRGIGNIAENLTFPARAVSCLLQAKWEGGGVELLRFLTNSTIGIAGIFDPADAWFKLYPREEDFGQAFACWGIGPGYTLVLPLCSATNVRDTVGALFDMAFDIKTYLPYGASTLAGVNKAVDNFRPYHRLLKGYGDPYEIYKEFDVVNRQLKRQDWMLKMRRMADAARQRQSQYTSPAEAAAAVPPDPPVVRPAGIRGRIVTLPDYRPENAWSDTIRVLAFQPQTDESSWWTHLSPWNSDFTSLAEERELAALRSEADPVEYYFWRAPEPRDRGRAPLVFLLPGIGATHQSTSAVAMAEVLNRQGYAVIVLPSTFSRNFYHARHTALLPGYSPDDAVVLRRAMAEILDNLATESEKKRFVPESIQVVGMSLGALQAVHIAAQEEARQELKIRRYVAVNPPVDLVAALDRADACGKVTVGMKPQAAEAFVSDAFGKAMASQAMPRRLRGPLPAPADLKVPEVTGAPESAEYRMGIAEGQAKFLTSLSFRYSLRDVLMCALAERRIAPEGLNYTWSNRTRLYLELDRLGFRDYMTRFLLPVYSDRAADPEAFGRGAGLYPLEATLRGNDRVRVLHTLDDFLVSDAERRFLDRTLGRRIVWFARGGHLGNLYYGAVHRELLEQLK